MKIINFAFYDMNYPAGMPSLKIAGKVGVKEATVRKIIWDYKQGHIDFTMDQVEK